MPEQTCFSLFRDTYALCCMLALSSWTMGQGRNEWFCELGGSTLNTELTEVKLLVQQCALLLVFTGLAEFQLINDKNGYLVQASVVPVFVKWYISSNLLCLLMLLE